jgi:hypothetical protein
VREFVRGLDGATAQLKPATALLAFAGKIPAEVVDEMERLIDEDCERIDPHTW